MVAVHADEVLLYVVGPVELLLADIALEGLVLAVDVLMAGEQVLAVGRVGAVLAVVSLDGGQGVHLTQGTGFWQTALDHLDRGYHLHSGRCHLDRRAGG